ncbi:uncharacterized protein OCT59_021264 [Rhizophagus irregularis]|uniref:uncharacterized protein n=1 Tax=Rhizophagus irregularis TaxID=588596 RepID=UPI00332B9EA4|nr:hypothetical protein OCT59_021264 [Rhizophagus irregularis]
MVDNKLLPKLSQNLLEILNDEEYYDITIEVGSDPYVKVFRAHMIILNYRSPYLRRILSTNKKKNDGGIYMGEKFLWKNLIIQILLKLIAANELSLHELIPYLESFLIENKANWMEQNFELIYQTSFENNSFLKLQKFCNDLISKEPSKIFNSPNFSSIPEKLLITLIQIDNLQMDEIQVWEHELYNDLLEYFLDNDSKKSVPRIIEENKEIRSNIDSKIITFQHVELISKWIDRLEITDKLTNSYEFKLLYRDSRDGSGLINSRLETFREICVNQSRTITVIKIIDSNEIFGGYNPIEWKFDDSYGATKDSFIFSFSNNSIDNYILSRVKDEKKAIYNGKYLNGPTFNSDLVLYNDRDGLRINCNQCYYEKHIGKINKLYVEEFEVFQII